MAENILAIGTKENNTAKESILIRKERVDMENGSMERESDGLSHDLTFLYVNLILLISACTDI